MDGVVAVGDIPFPYCDVQLNGGLVEQFLDPRYILTSGFRPAGHPGETRKPGPGTLDVTGEMGFIVGLRSHPIGEQLLTHELGPGDRQAYDFRSGAGGVDRSDEILNSGDPVCLLLVGEKGRFLDHRDTGFGSLDHLCLELIDCLAHPSRRPGSPNPGSLRRGGVLLGDRRHRGNHQRRDRYKQDQDVSLLHSCLLWLVRLQPRGSMQ